MPAGEEGPQGIALPRATNDVKTALGPCIRPPNILRSRPSVVECARKYEQSKKSVIGLKEFFSEIVVVLVRKGS